MKPKIINTEVYNDKRGFFKELYIKKNFKQQFKFTAFSFSKKNVIRGLHYQYRKPQAKLVSVVKGSCLDVCVNINPNSKYFKKVFKFYLKPGKLLLVPRDYAHGFAVLSKELCLVYHLDEYRYKNYEAGISYNDPMLKINWNVKKPILSKRDLQHPSFSKRVKLKL